MWDADCCRRRTGTAPLRSTRSSDHRRSAIDPRAAIANDHFVSRVSTPTKSRPASAASLRDPRHREADYATPGDGIFHFYFPEQGLVMPGQFIPGRLAQPGLRAYGAGNWRGFDNAGFRVGHRYIYFTSPDSGESCFADGCSRGSAARTRPGIAAALGPKQHGQSSSSSTRIASPDRLPEHDANMMAEAEALMAFLLHAITLEWYRAKALRRCRIRQSRQAQRRVRDDESIDLSKSGR